MVSSVNFESSIDDDQILQGCRTGRRGTCMSRSTVRAPQRTDPPCCASRISVARATRASVQPTDYQGCSYLLRICTAPPLSRSSIVVSVTSWRYRKHCKRRCGCNEPLRSASGCGISAFLHTAAVPPPTHTTAAEQPGRCSGVSSELRQIALHATRRPGASIGQSTRNGISCRCRRAAPRRWRPQIAPAILP